MRSLLVLMLAFSSPSIAEDPNTTPRFSSWNDFKATTARTFRTGTNRMVVSEETRVSDQYRRWTFDADASVSGYYVIILYINKFCTSPPSAYFNYGEGTGGDYTFHGACIHINC